VILVKIEPTPGSDASPLASANAVQVMTNAVISPQGEEVARDNVRATMSPDGHITTGLYNTIPLDVELKGSGTAGAAPDFGPLLRACGFSEDVTADTSVAYSPVTLTPSSQESVTIYFYEDGVLHKMVGCRGSVSLSASVNGIATLSFSMSGMWVDPGDVALPDAVLSEIVPPVVEDLGLTVGGYTPSVNSLSFDVGNTVSQRKDVNAEGGIAGFFISARTTSGSIDPEAVALGTFNPWSLWKDGTRAALAATIGSVAGNICALTAPAIQYKAPSYSEREGLRTYDLPFSCTGDDDELTLTFS
jgi:hypothetical protein